jgi:peptidyl-prolyl cis-trans isomerase B (cyclophilin B)
MVFCILHLFTELLFESKPIVLFRRECMLRIGLKYCLVLALFVASGLGMFSTAMAENSDEGKLEAPVVVKLQTTLGDIELELDPVKAPESVKNFLTYVDEGFYDGTIFHRIVPGFVIQGGGFEANMKQKATHAPIRNEAANGLKNDRYTVAMARTSSPNSATSQFYINLVDNNSLNYSAPTQAGYGYAVFGKVISGQDVVNKIARVQIKDSVPVEPVIITTATRVGDSE